MKNYEEMSDFEINCEVAKANNWSSKSLVYEMHSGKWNPCQNPEDAWPIITENKISIMFDSTDTRYEGEYHEWCDAISSCQKFGIQHQSNPLRAAMIVFLKMNEDKL